CAQPGRREEAADRVDGVGLGGALVGPVAFDARKAQRDAAGVARAPLHAVEGDLDDQRRLRANRPLIARALEAEQPLRLPGEHLVGEALEGLADRSEEHTSELQSPYDLVCRLLLEKKKKEIDN